jgi:hypothetical protein
VKKNPEKELGQVIVDDAQRQMDIQYPAESTINKLMRFQYFRLAIVTSNFTELKGKKVLDIGCGAKASPRNGGIEERRKGMYEPWFARFATVCGAEVTGIDRRKSEGENYTHIQADIAKTDVLKLLDDESFDIVNSSAFLVNSQKLDDARGILTTAPELLREYGDEDLDRLDHAITAEVTRILKEEGYFFYNERIYQKVKGELHAMQHIPTLIAEHGFPPVPDVHREKRSEKVD